MSSPLLARLGSFVARHPRRVVAGWCLAIALASPLAAQLPSRLWAEGNGVPGTESYRVGERLATEFSQAPGEPWIVVWRGERPALAERGAIAAAAARLRALPDVSRVLSPTDTSADPRLVAADRRSACLLVDTRRHTAAGVAAVRDAVAPLRATLLQRDPTTTLLTTGAFPLGNDLTAAAGHDSVHAERLLLGPVLLLLVGVFGSPLAALLPLVIALAAAVLAFAAGALVAQPVGLNAFFQTVVSMLGLALGIDYALLITARFREARGAGADPVEAASAACGTAGWTVACAGGVVLVSLSALLPLGLMDARSVGLGGALVVAIAVALALGLLPALLVMAGPWLDWPRRPARAPRPATGWSSWGRTIARHRFPAALVALALLGALALPLAAYRPGVPDMRFYPAALESVQGVSLLETLGRRGWTDPMQVLVSRRDGGPILGAGGLGPLLALSRRLHADPRVAEVLGPVDLAPGLQAVHYAVLYARPGAALTRYPDLARLVSRDGRTAVLQVVSANTVDVKGAEALAASVRAYDPDGLSLQVGGLAALNLDYEHKIQRSMPVALGWLLLASSVILGLTFRAVLVPLKAVALNLLVVCAAIGSLVWVFQLGHGAGLFGLAEGLGTLPSLVPMMVFCLTFGLSMDYEIFMIGRVREERTAGDGEEAAIVRGLAATGGVVTAAAGIMVLVCGAFAGAQMIFVKLFGTGMALAILLDVTVVRLVLAPALLAIAGRWNWWPGDGEGYGPALGAAERELQLAVAPPQHEQESQA